MNLYSIDHTAPKLQAVLDALSGTPEYSTLPNRLQTDFPDALSESRRYEEETPSTKRCYQAIMNVSLRDTVNDRLRKDKRTDNRPNPKGRSLGQLLPRGNKTRWTSSRSCHTDRPFGFGVQRIPLVGSSELEGTLLRAFAEGFARKSAPSNILNTDKQSRVKAPWLTAYNRPHDQTPRKDNHCPRPERLASRTEDRRSPG